MRKLLLLLFPIALWATNGYQQIGIGTRSQGMGGVGVSYPQDTFAVAHNPAGTAYIVNRADLELQYRHSHANVRIRPFQGNAFEFRHTTSTDALYPSAGANQCLSPCLTTGLAFYRLGGWKVDYDAPLPQLAEAQLVNQPFPPQTPTSSQYEVYLLSPSIAWKLSRCHAFGLSLNVGFSWLDFDGIQPFATPANSIHPNSVTNRGTSFTSGVGFSIGWIGHLFRSWTVGLSYRSKTWMTRHTPYEGFIADQGRFDIPAQWGIGTTFHCCDTFLISADAVRIMWADVKMLKHDQHRTGRYGSFNGRGFGWKDQFAAKVGLEWRLLPCFTLRGGWNYGDIQTGAFECLINSLTQSVIEHHFTIGATYRHRCHELSVAYVHELYHNVACFDATANRHIKLKSEQKVAALSYAYLW